MRKSIMAAIAATIALSPMPAAAKKNPELSSLQIQQMQTRDIEAPKNLVFGAVMTILQDSGYRIEAADKDTGLITGIGSSKGKLTWAPFVGFGKSKKTPIVSAFIEDYGSAITRVRLSFVMAKIKSSLYGSQPQDEEPIYDTQTYNDAFEKLNQNVFLRQSMNVVEKNSDTAPSSTEPPANTETPEEPAEPVLNSSVTCETCNNTLLAE